MARTHSPGHQHTADGHSPPPQGLSTARASGTVGPPSGTDGDIQFVAGARPLDEYELVKVLGKGGFGEVWQARGPGGLMIALKFVRLDGAEGAVELRSLEVMRNIRHAHLLPLIGCWQRPPYLLLAMELADGTLQERLQAVRAQGLPGIPAAELHEYLREAAKGIDFLGSRGIVHRDIKPRNLLFVGGSVKVADFGLAKVFENTASVASNLMTPAYAAPEMFRNRLTAQSDQYSLAVSYYQLHTGKLLYRGSPAEVMGGHLAGEPDLTPLPPAERSVVARALAKEPADRWSSCGAFAAALANTADTLPRRSGPPAPTEDHRSQLPARRRLAAAVLVGLLLLTAATFGSVAWLAGALDRAAGGPSAAAVPNPVAPELLVHCPEELKLTAGQSAKLAVTVERRHCTGPVDVNLLDLPRGVTAGPVAVPDDRDAVEVGVTASADVDVATVPVRVRASLGNVAAERKLTVVLAAAPAVRILPLEPVETQAGKTARLRVGVQRLHCQGEIELTAVDLPQGVTVAPVWVPSGFTQAELLIAAGTKADTGAFTARVRARLDALTDERTATLTIHPLPRLKLLALRDVTLPAGKSIALPVEVERINLTGPIDLRIVDRDLPAGVTATGGRIGPDGKRGEVTLRADVTAAAAKSKVRLDATAADADGTAAFQLSVAREIENSLGMKLALIPPGRFTRGRQEPLDDLYQAFGWKPSDPNSHIKSEAPAHTVHISRPYYLGAHEVTVGQFREFVAQTGHRTDAEVDNKGSKIFVDGKGSTTWKTVKGLNWKNAGIDQTDSHPVVHVSYRDAEAFCKWLSDKEKKTYRLPTEAEWEYACRAGTKTRFWNGDDPAKLVGIANVRDATLKARFGDWEDCLPGKDGHVYTAPVESYRANPFGLYDMHGNVWEICADWYAADTYRDRPVTDPAGPSTGKFRVLRGGCFY